MFHQTGSKKHTIDISEDDPALQLPVRKTLKVIHNYAGEKENITAAPHALKPTEHEAKKKQPTMVSTSTQTDKVATYVVSEEELTSATVNSNYWRVRAEECTARYHETLLLNHDLRKRMEHYKGLYEMSQTLLQESRDMVEVLKEVLGDAEGAAKVHVDTTATTAPTVDRSSSESSIITID